MYLSKRKTYKNTEGFTLLEVITALMIVTLITSTVLVTINRYAEQTINRQLAMQAFHLARENMEKILASDTIEETLEFSTSDDNPDIQTTSVVETFFEPQTERMWIRAVCSASFTDAEGKEHTLDFTHWVTDISMEQMIQIIEFRQWQSTQAAQQQLAGGGTQPPAGGTGTTTSGQTNTTTTTSSTSDKPYEWLPDGWNSMTKDEQRAWLWRYLLEP